MAGESQLRDAKIRVIIDTSGALNTLPKPGSEPGRPGTPGSVPSIPGRRPPGGGRSTDLNWVKVDGAWVQFDPRSPRRPRRPGRRPGHARIPRALKTAVGAIATTAAISFISEALPGMAPKEEDIGGSTQKKVSGGTGTEAGGTALQNALGAFGMSEREFYEGLNTSMDVVGSPLAAMGAAIRFAEAAAPILGAITGTAIDVARSNAILGLGISAGNIKELAVRGGTMASVTKGLQIERRRRGREVAGSLIPEATKAARDFLMADAATSK